MWAGRIIGFGEFEYRYETGHGGRAPLLAFAPGSTKHTIYLVNYFSERWPDLMARLGKHKASKVCLHLTRLTGVDRGVLRELLERSLADMWKPERPESRRPNGQGHHLHSPDRSTTITMPSRY